MVLSTLLTRIVVRIQYKIKSRGDWEREITFLLFCVLNVWVASLDTFGS
jgi:hypothetical protein